MTPLESRMAKKRESLFSDLVTFVERCLVDLDIPPHKAAAVASLLAGHIANYWGGQNMNIPKDFLWKFGQREMEIFNEVRGNNLGEVARRYDMTERGLRKLVGRVTEQLRAQAKLHDDEQQMGLLEQHSEG